MALTNFFFREDWVGSEVAGMKIAFFTIFDLIWIHIFAQKGLNTEFLKQTFNFHFLKTEARRQKPYYHQVCDKKPLK